ncbi:MAG: 7-cyano-7-deazaguanine synthase QueC [Phycisphaerales bacterium]|nr:7-cyano-7-deazaguanine synthase QueC [Phycisphaerales bacterium]
MAITHEQMPAVVLLSGGLDSATVLAIARAQGHECHALSFDYGQRHRFELESAVRVAHQLGAVSHKTVAIDLRAFGGSALTDAIDVPKHRDDTAMAHDIPVTYVPARNLVFLSLACGFAEVLNANTIFIGVNAVDYSGYPDCRPAFIESFARTANLATKAGIEGHTLSIQTPLIDMTKADIIRRGHELGVDFGLTHSCYDPDAQGRACGSCDSCIIRRKGFTDAGVPDPTRYADSV